MKLQDRYNNSSWIIIIATLGAERKTFRRILRYICSEMGSPTTRIQTYLHGDQRNKIPGLLKLSEQNTNDRRHTSYVNYINELLRYFGKERVHLVGSTAENLKLRWSTDGGDADFLLVSGRLEIPVANIIPRSDTPRYIWLRGDHLDERYRGHLLDGKYLCAQLLRTVDPQLFTTLRAIHTIVTSPADFVPGRESRMTSVGVNSKVGLARLQMRDLVVDNNAFPGKTRGRHVGKRCANITAQLKLRWKEVKVNQEDLKTLKRLLKIVALVKEPGTKGEHHGSFNYFATMLSEALSRPSLFEDDLDDEEVIVFENDMDIDENHGNERIKATYDDKTSKDFVPAARVSGKLQCMVDFRNRMTHAAWPSQSIAEDIFNNDVFVICRSAPLNPSADKDFCLGFNLSEITLSQNMPEVAKTVYIIMKSYLKGLFQKRFNAKNREEVRLKSYHVKTAIFWTLEKHGSCSFWTGTSDDSILQGIRYVLDKINKCLKDRQLCHYFVTNSNMFDGFQEEEYSLCEACVDEIMKDPVGSIALFFELDKAKKAEYWLSPDEFEQVMALKKDGGRKDFVDRLEDALIDMLRGFNEAPRSPDGSSPIRNAALGVIELFRKEEQEKTGGKQSRRESNCESQLKPEHVLSGNRSGASVVGGLLNMLPHKGKDVQKWTDGLVQFASHFPESRKYIDMVGGSSGVWDVLQAASSSDPLAEIRAAVDRYLSCPDDVVDSVAMELKQKIIAYFIGQKEL
ncbi:hypothetical protein MAR_000321 [Mya arenaria]|uniref:Mab-21-like HhH/H2TH-like domain-containing protein n=2 Tax=Mya arenaria TaxID=6604 RepID=A0ABY7F8J1_MYAAR|nr:hypothetical protein MAR_000321 [Mya arenaria]